VTRTGGRTPTSNADGETAAPWGEVPHSIKRPRMQPPVLIIGLSSLSEDLAGFKRSIAILLWIVAAFAVKQSRLNWFPQCQTLAVSPTFGALDRLSPTTSISLASSRSNNSKPATGGISTTGFAHSPVCARTLVWKTRSFARSPRRGIPDCRLNSATGGFGPGYANAVSRNLKPNRSEKGNRKILRPSIVRFPAADT
jgi:hypothetical protein